MFGASEDRARQLAFRKRRERVSSSGSSSSMLRSLSSASRVSQQSNLSLSPGYETTKSVGCPEQHSMRAVSINSDENTPANQLRQPNFGSFSTMDMELSQMDRQRLQAEYLSHVLYDDLSLASARQVLKQLPIGATQAGQPRVPELWAAVCRPRNITAPVASPGRQSFLGLAAEHCLPLPMLSPSSETAYGDHSRAQSMVTLRGGGPTPPSATQKYKVDQYHLKGWENPEPKLQPVAGSSNSANWTLPPPASQRQPTDQAPLSSDTTIAWSLDPERPYMKMLPLLKQLCHRPAWKVPITGGKNYESFLSNLSTEIIDRFLPLFGPLYSASHWTSPLANARRDFRRKLDHGTKEKIGKLIAGRITEIMAPAKVGRDPQLEHKHAGNPPLMLYHLLETTERSVLPEPSFFSSPADYKAYIKASRVDMRCMDGRSTSTPNLGQQQGYAAYLITIDASLQCEQSTITCFGMFTNVCYADTSVVAAAARLALPQPRLRSAKFSTTIARIQRENRMPLESKGP
jgi:hypothetical protein